QAAAEVGVLAVKVDGGVEAADALERLAADGEIAAVEDRADAQQVLDEQLRRGREREVEGPLARLVMRADNDADPQRNRCAIVAERRGIPTRMLYSLMGPRDAAISAVQQRR